MNTEEQIQKRAKIAASGFSSALSPENLAALERRIASELSAQQSAYEAAHREEVERLEKKVANLTESNNQIGKHSNEILTQRDTARAELEKLSETISRITEVARSANELLATCGYIVSITTIPSI